MTDPAEALTFAIKDNDDAKVRQLLGAHPELKATINQGTDALGFGATPLIAAVRRGNRDMIDTLLTPAEADLTVKSDWWAGGFSVLESASDDLVPFLVERGAVIDAAAAAKFGMVDRLAEIVAADPAAVHQSGAATERLRSIGRRTSSRRASWWSTARTSTLVTSITNRRPHNTRCANALTLRAISSAPVPTSTSSSLRPSATSNRTRQILDHDPHAVEMTISAGDFPNAASACRWHHLHPGRLVRERRRTSWRRHSGMRRCTSC